MQETVGRLSTAWQQIQGLAWVWGSRPAFILSSGYCHQATGDSELPETCIEMFKKSAAEA